MQVIGVHLPVLSHVSVAAQEPGVQTQVPAWQNGVVPLQGVAQGMSTQSLVVASHCLPAGHDVAVHSHFGGLTPLLQVGVGSAQAGVQVGLTTHFLVVVSQ